MLGHDIDAWKWQTCNCATSSRGRGGRLRIQSPAHTVSLTAELNPLRPTLVVPCASRPVQPGAADAHHSSHAWHHAPHSNGIAHVEGLPIRVSQGPGGSGLQGAGLSGWTRLGSGDAMVGAAPARVWLSVVLLPQHACHGFASDLHLHLSLT